MRGLIFSLACVCLAACAGPRGNLRPGAGLAAPAASPPATPPLKKEPSERTGPLATDVLPVEEAAEFQAGSELRASISRWIAENSEANFDDAARAANRYLRELGYPLALDVSELIGPTAGAFVLKAGGRVFTFRAGEELSHATDVCGERYLHVPGLFRDADEALLVSKEREFAFSLKGIRRERFRVLRGKTLVNTVYAPEPTEPIGVAANGSAVYLKFPLDEELTGEWWQRLARQQPALLDEEPYLALRVSKKQLSFDESLDQLPPQEFEVEPSGKGVFRWRFQPSNLVLELDSQCRAPAR